MIFFAALIFLFLVVMFWLGVVVFALPIVAGLLVVILFNALCRKAIERWAPIWWNLLSCGIVAWTTAMFWKDVRSDAVDTGAWPFLILLAYGYASLLWLLAVLLMERRKEQKNTPQPVTTSPAKPQAAKKRNWGATACRVLAVTCTVLSPMGLVAVFAGGQVKEGMIMLIVFASMAALFWMLEKMQAE